MAGKLNIRLFLAVSISVVLVGVLLTTWLDQEKREIGPNSQVVIKRDDTALETIDVNNATQEPTKKSQGLDLPYSDTADRFNWYLENEIDTNNTENLDTNLGENSETMIVAEEVLDARDGKPYNEVDVAILEFDAEQQDSLWSEEQQNEYFKLFSDDEELAKYVLENVVCKSSLCKLTVATTGQEQLLELLNQLALKLQNSRDSFDVSIDYKNENSHANLYIKQ